MLGIDLNRPIRIVNASFRHFSPGESHVTRFCTDDVLLLVYEGSLHFTEEGISYEIGAGEYFIQKKNTHQSALHPSQSPKYLYVHFSAEWGEGDGVLPKRGRFSPEETLPLMERLDRAHSRNRNLTEKSALFYQILSHLFLREEPPSGPANEIGDYLRKHAFEKVSLEELSARFSYSRNQIINLIKKEFGMTPLEYQHRQRLKRAEWLLRVTAMPLSRVAEECGYGEYSQFYKEFLRTYGASPKQWRAENRG